MKIIKKGISDDLFRGTCMKCGCEVEATRKELHTSLNVDMFCDFYLRFDSNSAPSAKTVTCPECGSCTGLRMELVK